MMLREFKLLAVPEKINMLYDQGVYIGKRKVGNQVVLLYQLEEFYVEVFYAKYRHHIARIRCSASTLLIDPYLEQIDVENLVG